MIRDDIRVMWLCSESAMNGSANSSVTKIARIFGTNTSVCSWICVSAWNSDPTTPTTRPTTISGDDTTTMVQIASRATSRVSAPVISIPVLFQKIHPRHCEEPLRRSNPACRIAAPWIASRSLSSGAHSRDPLARNDDLDRHLHDVFVGLDHPVAPGHQPPDRHPALRPPRHHIPHTR